MNIVITPASQRAQRRHKANSLGIRGVRLNRAGNYQARIHVRSRSINLGAFATLEAASDAYAAAARAYYGEDARTR